MYWFPESFFNDSSRQEAPSGLPVFPCLVHISVQGEGGLCGDALNLEQPKQDRLVVQEFLQDFFQIQSALFSN